MKNMLESQVSITCCIVWQLILMNKGALIGAANALFQKIIRLRILVQGENNMFEMTLLLVNRKLELNEVKML